MPQSRGAALSSALRRARIENAERSDVVADLRGAELTRLEILREHLTPVFAEVPSDCDIFDPGIAPGEHPRLFIDMIAFVEMIRDRRTYSFVQDTRLGRVVIAESDRIDAMVKAVTNYIARRLIEREKALATLPAAARPAAGPPAESFPAAAKPEASGGKAPAPGSRAGRILSRIFLFVIEALGSAVFFALLAAGGFWLWQHFVR